MAAEALLLCADLLFTSKVTGTGKAMGAPVRVFPAVEPLLAAIGPSTGLVLVDLSQPASTSAGDLERLKRALPPSAKLVAYGSHVDAARLDEARSAGCDLVLPRSRFVEELGRLLGALAPSESPRET